jgi:radical SAM protein with 4Fe4S-binding SPASM domain
VVSLHSYPQVRKDWQVHLWEHPSRNHGCISATRTGNIENISAPLAKLLRRMTGDKSITDLAADVSRDGGDSSGSADLLLQSVTTLAEKGLVVIHDEQQAPRRFAKAVPHKDVLRILQMQLTNQCNLRCDHCYAGSDSRGHRGMTLDQVKTMIDEFVDLGGLRLFLTGGEIMLRPDLEEIIVYAKAQNLFVYLNTNGYAISPAKAKRLVELGVGAVNISVDGADAETHDTFRRRKGSFDRAMSAIESFCGEGIPLGVQMTVHKKNLGQAAALFDEVQPKGVSQCYFVRMVPQGRAEENSDLVPTGQEFYDTMVALEKRRVEHRAAELAKRGETVSPAEPAQGEAPVAEEIQKGTRCTAGTAQVYVRSDGACYPCTALDREQMCMGHYPESTLEEIWTRQVGPANDLREFNHGSIEHCRGCPRQTVCKGGCAGAALSYLGDWRKADPNGCIIKNVFKEVHKDEKRSHRLEMVKD